MKRIQTSEVAQHVGERVCVKGWLHTVRRLSQLTFLVVRDGWGMVQVIVEHAEPNGASALLPLEGLFPETVLEVEGIVRAQAQAPGGVELGSPTIGTVACKVIFPSPPQRDLE